VQFIAIPMLVLTGVAMWQAGRLRRFRRRLTVRQPQP
jgi:thiosulfate reductase cytochrome b subunit